MRPKHLGILGGMGPVATAHFYTLVIQGALAGGAKRDADFPRISLSSAVIPGFDGHGFTDGNAVREHIVAAAKELEAAGAKLIAMPCNTAHAFFDDLETAVSIPVLNMIAEVRNMVLTKEIRKIAILGTESTVEGNLYSHASLELVPLTSDEQEEVTRLIERGEENKHDASDTKALAELVESLSSRGADGIVLGCTELSLIELPPSPVPFFDSSRILAEAAIAACYS